MIMNKQLMRELIDNENGVNFYKNINLNGFNFYKGNSFISFKINKIEGIGVVHIRYLYADNKEDMMSILAYACNYWTANKIKFVYYKEKEKESYVRDTLKDLGFIVQNSDIAPRYKYKFKCKYCKGECRCQIIEAFV